MSLSILVFPFILVKTSKLIIDKEQGSLKNETSRYQIPSLRLLDRSDMSFTFILITPTRVYIKVG